jgi:hypothetical protein
VVCAALRRDHLKPQVDYVIERKRVMITETGYVALRGLLGCPESPDKEKARVSHCIREPEPISLIITSVRPPKNPHIIEAVPKEGGESVRVRVRNNANSCPGWRSGLGQMSSIPTSLFWWGGRRGIGAGGSGLPSQPMFER